MTALTDDFVVIDQAGVVSNGAAVRAVVPEPWLNDEDADPGEVASYALDNGVPLEEPGDGIPTNNDVASGLYYVDTETGYVLDESLLLVAEYPDEDTLYEISEAEDPRARAAAAFKHAETYGIGTPSVPEELVDRL